MNETAYIRKVLRKYIPKTQNVLTVKTISNELSPYLKCWAYPYFSGKSTAGSYAKGTSIIGDSDIDIFISLKHSFPNSLENIYNNLSDYMELRNFPVKKRNVSIQIHYKGFHIDIIPGKRQPSPTFDHSIYCNRTNTWKKTNIKKHIKYVSESKRKNEIRVLKVWRNINKLDFPSFYLELSVINALKGSMGAIIGGSPLIRNIKKVFEYLSLDYLDEVICDPSNTNNIVSDVLNKSDKEKIKKKANIAFLTDSLENIIW
jgi:hypothetical protein